MMFTNLEDFQRFSKESTDTALQSYGALTKGLQAIAVEVAEHSKKSFEDGGSALEKLFGAKSFDAAFEVQSGYVKDAYEALVARATKIGELASDTAREAYKPYEGIYAKAASR